MSPRSPWPRQHTATVAQRRSGRCTRRTAGKHRVEPPPLATVDLAPRQREQRQSLHPAGQRVRDTRHEHEIGRAGQQEASGPPVGVDGLFDREQQARRALHLVDHSPVEAAHQADRILLRGEQRAGIVQRQVAATAPRELLDECGLTRLARAVDEHHGRVT